MPFVGREGPRVAVLVGFDAGDDLGRDRDAAILLLPSNFEPTFDILKLCRMEGNDMPHPSVSDVNRDLARRINAEARGDPQSPYANKFVGIANGQIVAVTDDLDELARLIRHAEPDPSKTLCVEASCDYDEVHEIWGLI